MGSVKLLKASAGSGKTYQLAYEYVRNVIGEPMQYRHILAVTFTNKATEEMKRRILAEINELAQGDRSPYLARLMSETGLAPEKIRARAAMARTKILHDYSHFAILTIDKFFQRIIRSFVKELGIDLDFNLELQTDTLLSTASDALIEDIPADEALKKWIAAFVEEKIEENKRWDIKTELSRLGSEIFKENYRRSGTAVQSKEELRKIVASAVSQAGAAKARIRSEARQALRIMDTHGLSVADFSNGRNGVAGYIAKTAEGEITAYGKRVSDALGSDEKWYAKTSLRRNDILAALPELRPLLESICNTYDRHARFINSTELLRENYRNFALLSDLARKIEDICTTEGIMPISETNHILHKLVAGNDAPFIFEKAGNHFSRFMIDEFQDTSSMQWENFVPLLRNALSQSEETPVLLVGDVKQSIYRWRGGDWRILARQIREEFGAIVTEDLTVNYRSLSRIIGFNNRIISGCVEADNARLNEELDTAADKGHIRPECRAGLRDMLKSAYENQEQQAREDGGRGYVNITLYGKDEESGEAVPPVIHHIEQLQQRGYAPGDIAILVRYNAEGAKIANEILRYKSLHPDSPYGFDVVTQEALTIGAAPVTGFLLACLKMTSAAKDTITRAVYNHWLGYSFDRELDASETEFLAAIRLKSPLEAFEAIQIRYRLNESPENIAYLQAFQEQIIAFGNSTIADIPLFVKWWEENGAGQSIHVPAGKSAITIITIHKAKGLQYKAVIVPYCNWGLAPGNRTVLWADCGNSPFDSLQKIPIACNRDKMQASYFAEDYFTELVLSHVDNINTFYVATTRAMEELHLMLPDTLRKTSGRISTLIGECLRITGESAALGDMEGSVREEEGNTVIEFGHPEPHRASAGEKSEESLFSPFLSFETSGRLRLRLHTQRYYEEDPSRYALSPRDYGVLLHRVFETSASREEIGTSVLAMQRDGLLSEEETVLLAAKIEAAFANPLVRSWFDGSWEIVRNESEIIVPQGRPSRRPDRVMLKGDRAVVVDYKFGMNRPASHRRQIAEYMALLREMGYKKIEGYLWYVSLDDIEPVA